MQFTTLRLFTRLFTFDDQDVFFEMMRDPIVMGPIPQKPMNRIESKAMLDKIRNSESFNAEKQVRAVCIHGQNEMIGLAAIMTNSDGENEIGYRLRQSYWGVGYGTEIAEGILRYGFENVKAKLMTADVCVDNDKSVKILRKYLKPVKTFFNEKDNCMDARYKVTIEEWNELMSIREAPSNL